jgi:hypothetical protein
MFPVDIGQQDKRLVRLLFCNQQDTVPDLGIHTRTDGTAYRILHHYNMRKVFLSMAGIVCVKHSVGRETAAFVLHSSKHCTPYWPLFRNEAAPSESVFVSHHVRISMAVFLFENLLEVFFHE